MNNSGISKNSPEKDHKSVFKNEQLLNAVSSPLILLDESGKIIFFNNTAKLLTGFELYELGDSLYLSELLSDKDDSVSKINNRIDAFKAGSIISRILTKSGLYIPVELSLTPYEDSESGKKFFIVQVTDIRSNIELEQKDSLLTAALTSSLDGMAILDRRLKITLINSAFAEMLGTKRENLTGVDIFAIPQAALSALEKKNFLMTLKQSGTWRGIIQLSTTDGRIKQIEVGIYKILTESESSHAGFIAVCRDVTESEEQISRIRTLSFQLKAYSQLIIKAMTISNFDAALSEICSGLEKISDIKEASIILFNRRKPYYIYHSAKTVLDIKQDHLFNFNDHPQTVVNQVKCYEKVGSKTYMQQAITDSNDNILPDNRLWILLKNEYDKPIGFVTAIILNKNFEEQITALDVFSVQFSLFLQIINLQTTLNISRKEMEDFIYSVSHDLKTPVMSIVGFSDILKQKTGEKLTDDERHCLNRIEANVNLINTMVSSLLELSRAGKVSAEQNKVLSVFEIVEGAKNKVEEKYQTNIKITVAPNLPLIEYDARALNSIFYHFLDNCYKFQRKETPLQIEIGYIDRKEDYVFYIKDNGVGIPTKGKERIFEPFFRLCPKETEGIGIGLAIIKKILDLNDGEVWFESVEGEGSTFYFSVLKKHSQSSS